MKPVLQFATSVLALSGLLFQATANATTLAEQPLKASVLAKPNVIFGMDDSGSMDFEVMLYSNDGAFWWNIPNTSSYGSGAGLDGSHPNVSMRTVTANWFNSSGSGASGNWRKMVYLFPNGSGANDQRKLTDSQYDHFAILPTSEFAHMRWSGVYKNGSTYEMAPSNPSDSPNHNPLYYNPLITYKPWSPAQLSSGAFAPVDATPSATRAHPITSYGSSVFDLTGSLSLNTDNNKVFTALPGMTIPAGSKKKVCNWTNGSCPSSWTDVTADETAVVNAVTRVAMAYHPATYWVKESCTADPGGTSVAAKSCVQAPDGSWLKRYEIKSSVTSYPSGRTYTAELQNFANWFQYYRKRKFMLAAAMGETLETLTGMRLGIVRFNSLSGTPTMYDADSTVATSNRLRAAGHFYENPSNGGTPTRETLNFVGAKFSDAGVIQYACQRNNAFIVTDGFATNTSPTPPAYQSGKSAATWGSGVPYETTHIGSIADFGLRYYTNNPRTDLTLGKSPTTTRDTNPDLHVNTYGLTLGARGVLLTTDTVAEPTSASAWASSAVSYSPISIDDLWHATINGRGRMYLATTPEETALRIRAGLDDIKSQVGAQSSVAVSSFNLLASDGKAYEASYNPSGWVGDLTASPINTSTGVISTTPTWSAGTLLTARDWTTRVIVASDGTSGVEFTSAAVGGTVAGSTGFAPGPLIDYLRGSRANEGSTYRTRTSLMGSVLNAEPVVDIGTGVVYVASGEGMLHAFNSSTGAEEWAYVPYGALSTIGQTALRDYAFKTKLDGSPTVGAYGSGKLLVAGMGAAGRRYYAIDVTSPLGLSQAAAAANVKWTFPAPSDGTNYATMGYTVGRPVVTTSAADGDVTLVTSGYDNGETIGDGKGRLWMLNSSTGGVIRTFTTTAGSTSAEAGLAQIAAYREDDGKARYVYGGDLLGNLWKFDLNTGTTTLVASLKDASGNPQPVTTKPLLTQIDGKRVIMVGTGRLLDIGDFGSTNVQTIYAISDTGTALSNARTATTQLTMSASDIMGKVDWATSRGWHLDLPSGQQVNVDPKMVLGYMHVNANTAGGSNCAQSANHYMIKVRADGATASSVIGSTELLSADANALSSTYVQSGDKMFEETRLTTGENLTKERIDPSVIPARKNAWRDIVR